MALKIAINGFGRIGRMVARLIAQREDVALVAINDPTPFEMSLQLLRFDSIHGTFNHEVKILDTNHFQVDSQTIIYSTHTNPEDIDFAKSGAEIVLECSGLFLTKKQVEHHLQKGVKKVIISAVAKDDTPTYVLGVNHENYKDEAIISNGSCTTNCLAPIAKLLDENFGVQKAFMTTIHSYTNGQNLLDSKHPNDLRRARAAALNIIPTTTHAAQGIYRVLPNLKGKMDGQSVRVPVADVSMMDLVVKLSKKTTKESVNELLIKASQNELHGIILVDKEKRVSSDFYGSPYSAVVAEDLTQILDGDLLKIMAWYDNECGYSNRLIEMAQYISKR